MSYFILLGPQQPTLTDPENGSTDTALPTQIQTCGGPILSTAWSGPVGKTQPV